MPHYRSDHGASAVAIPVLNMAQRDMFVTVSLFIIKHTLKRNVLFLFTYQRE